MRTEEEVRKELEMMLRESEKERSPDAWKHITGYISALRWMLDETMQKSLVD